MGPFTHSTNGFRRSLVNDWVSKSSLYSAEEEQAHDTWRSHKALAAERRQDGLQNLIPNARAGNKEAQNLLRSVMGGLSDVDNSAATSWAAGKGLSTATITQFGLGGKVD